MPADHLTALGISEDQVDAAAAQLVRCYRRRGKVLVFGNGGSAAEAQHLAAELVGRFQLDRPALAAIALTTDTSVITAIGNDFGFDHIFARQVEALGLPGDVALGISTSGSSPNVLAGVRTAASLGLTTVGLVGPGESALASIVDTPIVVETKGTPAVQEAQLAVVHALCERVETTLFGDGDRDIGAPRTSAIDKVVEWSGLLVERESWRKIGAQVVWTNGCFDLLHVGHVRSLEAASRLGDVLVVGVNSDSSVRGLKGEGRPLVSARQRAELVAALGMVDRVVIFEDPTPVNALERLRPDVHAKGADYASKPMPERSVVEGYGGRVELLPLIPDISTTALLRRARPGLE